MSAEVYSPAEIVGVFRVIPIRKKGDPKTIKEYGIYASTDDNGEENDLLLTVFGEKLTRDDARICVDLLNNLAGKQ